MSRKFAATYLTELLLIDFWTDLFELAVVFKLLGLLLFEEMLLEGIELAAAAVGSSSSG